MENIIDKKELAGLQFLTAKPVLYVCNVLESEAVDGNEYSRKLAERVASEGANKKKNVKLQI